MGVVFMGYIMSMKIKNTDWRLVALHGSFLERFTDDMTDEERRFFAKMMTMFLNVLVDSLIDSD